MIFWAGVSSDDVGAVVERYPELSRPARRQETIQIPGRNGDLVYSQNVFDNYDQTYEIYFRAGCTPRAPLAARKIARWLSFSQGYQRLEDTYEPDIFRLAVYTGPTEIENIMNRFGRSTVVFNCKPQRFLKSGEYAIKISTTITILNPCSFTSLPYITVYGNGPGTLQIGSYTVKILSLDQYVTLDSETQNAYKGTKNKNNTISAPEFPRLEPGENAISWTGGITHIEIIPRWWTL